MKKYATFIIAIVWLSIFLLPRGTVAQTETGTFTVSPMIGGYMFEGNQDIEDKPVYGIGVGYYFDRQLAAEAVFNYIDTESDVGHGDVKAYLYRLDGLYHFNIGDRLVPYVAAGVGGITFDRDRGDNNSDPLFNYGAGLKYFITDTMALRGDVRHVISFDSTHHNLMYTVGLTFFFGGTKEAMAREPQDSDGDGVYDTLDKCPGTPSGVSVDSSGCPLDSDGDGVYDYLDKCPDTPLGARVDERGCWVLKGVQFNIGKATIKSESYPILDDVVEVLKKNPQLNIEIQGHTDSTGSAALNQKLSQDRASAVMEYFTSKGIEKTRLTAKGFGMEKPIASNATADGRTKNRRVELKPVR